MEKSHNKYFTILKTISFFGREIYKGIIELSDAFKEQVNLKTDINEFKESAKPKKPRQKRKQRTNF